MSYSYVQGTIQLESRTAVAWDALVDSCRRSTGVTLRITSPYGGRRTLSQQWAMWRDRKDLNKYPAGVAFPGTSVHGDGTRVDINNWGSASVWLSLNAPKFGFTREFANEPWHFRFRSVAGGGASGSSTPFSEESENSMILLYNAAVKGVHEVRRAVVQPGILFLEIGDKGAGTVGEAIRQQRGLKPSAPQSAVTVDVSDSEWEVWKKIGTPPGITRIVSPS